MNRHCSILFRLWSIIAVALGLGYQSEAYAGTDDVTINGSVINYGETMNGIYSFNTLKPGVCTPVKVDINLSAEGGGVLAGDCYYSIRADKTLHVYDADVWEERYSTPITNVALDLAYDETTKQIYGCFVDNGPQLGILLPEEGTYKKIAPLSMPIAVMVCDAEGKLFVVGGDGFLYEVNKETGEMTEIGSTEQMPMFAQSATIDPETGKCYWVTLSPNFMSGLFELDLTSGKTTWIYDFPNFEEMTGLFIMPKINDDAPAKADNIRLDGTKTNVMFTAPTHTVAGSKLANKEMSYTVEVYTQENGKTKSEEFKAMPGTELNYKLAKSNGKVKVSVIFKNEKGNGEKATLFFWMGKDSAGKVGNLIVEKETNTSARISWDAPTEGEHGGDFDKSTLTYKVIRYPENIVVSTNNKNNWYIDELDNSELNKYWYEVIPYTENNTEGVSATSNKIVLGNPYELPYNEPFDMGTSGNEEGNFSIYTVVDANNDNETWYYDSYAGKVKYPGNSDENGDDWLITPPVHIEAGSVCEFSFVTTVGFDGFYTEHAIEVAMGNKPGIKDLKVQLLPVTKYTSSKGKIVKVKFEAEKEDEYYFGIHIVSESRSMEFSVDDISIVKKASVEGPAGVKNLKIIPGANGALSADISFTTPTTTYNGKDIKELTKVEVYRNEELIKTYNNVQKGQELSLQDVPSKSALYTYKVVAYSEKGSGDETEMDVFVGVDVPGEVKNINLSEDSEGNVYVSWEAPTTGKNGGYIDISSLKYTVLRNGWKAIAKDCAETNAVDPMEDLIEGTQGIVQYLIKVSTNEGQGEEAYSSFLTAGKPYEMPFVESFIAGFAKYTPWSTMPTMNGAVWRNDRFDDGEPYDEDKGMMCYVTENTKPVHSMLLSPKVRINNAVKPTLSFWISNSVINDDLNIEVWADNKVLETIKKIDLRSEKDWTNYSIDLTQYKNYNSIQFAFNITNAVKGDRLYIDAISIKDDVTHNLAAKNMKAPISIQAGSEGVVEVNVQNIGKETAEDYTVEFFNGDKMIAQAQGKAVEVDSTVTISSTFVPNVSDMDEMKINAVIKYDADENLENNVSETVTVKVLDPGYPTVSDLTAISDERGNNLEWSVPDMSVLKPQPVTEDFESYESFTISDLGDWTLIDVDQNQYTMEFKNSKFEWITYPNSGGAMSFQVIDLSKINVTADDGWTSISGDKFLICPYASGNEDWLISPELYQTEQEIIINAKSLNFYEYGLESFTLLYSTTDKERASFKELDKATDISTDWTEYRFTLPADAKYFAVRATNINSALFIDDITYIPASSKPMELAIKGYNIYRDNEKINDALVSNTSYTDTDVEKLSEYTYTVTVMYDLGESGFSNEAVVTTLTGINDAENGISIIAGDNKIVIRGAEGKNVTVTDINGMLITDRIAENVTTINVNNGVYIISTEGKTYKVVVK